SELRDEVTELARRYGIVTPYTAYLIMEDESRRGVPEPVRSLESLQEDRGAREEAGRSWQQFRSQAEGDSAVADARYSLNLKSAEAAAPAASSGSKLFLRRYGLVGGTAAGVPAQSVDPEKSRLVEYAQQTQFVGGKNFFQNGDQWIDSTIQKFPKAN